MKQRKVDITTETKKIISFKEQRALQLEKENMALKKEIEFRNKLIKKLDVFILNLKNSILVKKLKNLGNEEFVKKSGFLNIEKGDILLVEDISIASGSVLSRLKDYIEVIIYEKGTNRLLPDKFMVIEKKNFPINETKYFASVEKGAFERELKKAAKLNKKTDGFLKSIVEEYRRERFSDNIK